jgi:Uma2 family endonuclease
MLMAELSSGLIQVQPAQGEWTYEDYLNLPDDGNIYEIIERVLYVTNAPGLEHQFTVVEIIRQLSNFVIAQKLGLVLTAPFEVHLSERTRPVQPDILFIKAERLPPPDTKFFEGAPELIVEVLSPTSIRTDQYIKFSAYEQAGVLEYWIANPKTRSVEVFTLAGNEYILVGQFVGDELIESKLLPGLSIIANTLFME